IRALRPGHAAFDIIVVDRACIEKWFVMTNLVKGHAAVCSARGMTAMAMVFHRQAFVGSLPHRHTAIGGHRMTCANSASLAHRNGEWRQIGRALTALAALTVLAGCEDKNAYVAPPPPKVDVATPVQRPVTRYIEATGNTAPIKSVDLVARVQGFLQSQD